MVEKHEGSDAVLRRCTIGGVSDGTVGGRAGWGAMIWQLSALLAEDCRLACRASARLGRILTLIVVLCSHVLLCSYPAKCDACVSRFEECELMGVSACHGSQVCASSKGQ